MRKKVLGWRLIVPLLGCFFLIVLIGLGLMGLDPAALCVSLVVGQVGFIFDRLRQK